MDLNNLGQQNQTIKIVPSIEDSLRTSGFNIELDQSTLEWFYNLTKGWSIWKKSSTIESQIEMFLQSSPEPFRIALVIVIKCSEYKDSKPKSLPYYIIDTLNKLSQKIGLVPEDDMKLPAFNIAIQQRNLTFISLVIKTFNIVSIKNIIIPKVKDMIVKGNYKQSLQIIIAMKSSHDFQTQDLLFPLILQDKSNLVDEYLIQFPNEVEPFLSFLDELIDKQFNLREYTQNYVDEHKITGVKYEKLHYKPLGRLVARLCNKFKIPISFCKNLTKNRTSSALRYLVYQRYVEKNVSPTVWDDLVKDALQQNSDSALEFVDFLVDYDRKEALKWADYLKIPEQNYPTVLKDTTHNIVSEVECWDLKAATTTQEFYKLSLHCDQVKIINNGETFFDAVSALKEEHLIGIDCEWKPSFGTTPPQVAIIQLSTKHAVYLIDVLSMNTNEYASFWNALNRSVFNNTEIIKIGFGLEFDLKEIKASVVGLNNIKLKGESLLDMSLLWKSLVEVGLQLPYEGENGGSSLSSLVKSCFNLPLEKSEQCSNWELRPLRQTQIDYAALDSYVLLEIYLFLQNISHIQELKFEDICNDVMLDVKQKPRKIKVAEMLQQAANNKLPKRSVQQTKLLVDFNISPLASYLRHIGIDSILISPQMLWHEVIDLAISEERLILLSKLKKTSSPNYPQSSILEVCSKKSINQLQHIVNHFNIAISKTNDFNICVYCNNKPLKKITVQEINILHSKYGSVSAENFETYHNDDYENYDNFFSDSDDDDLLQSAANHVPTVHKTPSGAQIDMNNFYSFYKLQIDGKQCEACGKFLWDDEELVKKCSEVTSNLHVL